FERTVCRDVVFHGRILPSARWWRGCQPGSRDGARWRHFRLGSTLRLAGNSAFRERGGSGGRLRPTAARCADGARNQRGRGRHQREIVQAQWLKQAKICGARVENIHLRRKDKISSLKWKDNNLLTRDDGLEGKVALISRGSSGIGASLAVLYAKSGCDSVISYIESDGHDPQQVVKAVEAEGRRCIAVACDVSSAEEVDDFAQVAIDEFGRLDI